jgi:hypothetical protein
VGRRGRRNVKKEVRAENLSMEINTSTFLTLLILLRMLYLIASCNNPFSVVIWLNLKATVIVRII